MKQRLGWGWVVALAVLVGSAGAQGAGERTAVQKPARTVIEAWHEPDLVALKFRDGLPIRLQGEGLEDGGSGVLAQASGVLAGVAAGSWQRTHRVDLGALANLRERARARSGREMPDLALEFRLRLLPGADAAAAIDALNALSIVELAWPVSQPPPPPLVPDFSGQQGYLAPAAAGLGTRGGWPLPGGTGLGVRVCDIEYEFNASHVDLPLIQVLGPPPGVSGFGTNHATAVLGLLFGKSDGEGITGGVYRAQPCFAAAYVGGNWNVAAAITDALSVLEPGDVILIEQQAFGPGGAVVPCEWLLAEYNATLVAVAGGVTVVAAGGNGSQNLDHPAFISGHAPFLPQNDSGAILVGAGAVPGGSAADRSRLGFSNFGSRLNVQGWGELVTTAGYGDLFGAVANELYTGTFGGTSSASAIVAAAAAQLSSVYAALTGHPIAPLELRELLETTGSPQQPGVHPTTQNIGPRPNLAAALDALGTLRGCPQAEGFAPEPVPPLAGRRDAAIAYDSARGRTVVFGGQTATLAALGDTWAFDGNGWSLISTGGPSPRAYAGMAYDRRRDRLVLFGGWDAGGIVGDTWEFDGSTWSLRSTSGPAPMILHAMAYDAARERTVLLPDDGFGATTWEWNGTSWSSFSGGPTGRRRAALAFDSDRGRLVLFGGTQIGPLDFAETWERSGTAWNLVAIGGPSPRSGAGLVYDTGRRRSVLFGGAQTTPFVKHGDLWEWNGLGWQQVTGVPLPTARTYHVMAYDEARDLELVFAGDTVTTIATRDVFLRSREQQPGIPYCFGDGSGAACPCGNASPAGECRGCLNSLGLGGTLRAHGRASLANDTVVLSASGVPNGPALFFQGTSSVAGLSGVPFADGLRCAGGGVVRLATVSIAGGGASYPQAGQLSISQKGGLGAPGTYTYQLWYRDPVSFCTSATSNLSNGVAISWGL